MLSILDQIEKKVANTKDDTFIYRNRRVEIPAGYLAVGLIVGVHGLRGEVKVESHTDFPERFTRGNTLALGNADTTVSIDGSRPHKGHVLLKLAGVNNRNQADELRNLWLFVPEEDAATLDDGTYWIHDLIGLNVQTGDGMELGKITDVLVTGANDVYSIQPVGNVNLGRELLLPAIADVVKDVDLDNGLMTVSLPPGLLQE